MRWITSNLIWIWLLSLVWVSAVFPQTPVPTPTTQTSPVVTPSPGTGEECLACIDTQLDRESWVDTYYDPVITRMGQCIRPKDIIIQSATANLAVIATYGYKNTYYGDGSGDIRGLACQGYIDIEGTEIVGFRWMNIFVSRLYAAPPVVSDMWIKVKAIKKLSKLQVKPKHPKKVNWEKSYGLKEKKAQFEAVVR